MRNQLLAATIGLMVLLPGAAGLADDLTRAPRFNWEPIHMPPPVFGNSRRATAALQPPRTMVVAKPQRVAAAAPRAGTATASVPTRVAAWASGINTAPARPLDRATATKQYVLGNWYYGHLHYEDAVTAYKAAVAADPGMDLAHYQLGNVLAALRRFPEATLAYKKAISIKTRFDSYNSLGLAYRDLGQYNLALPAFTTAIKLAKGQRLHLANAYYNLGNVQPGAAAVLSFRASLASDPRDPKVYDALGKTLMALRRYGEAVVAYQQEVRLNPKARDRMMANQKLQQAVAAVKQNGPALAARPQPATAIANRTLPTAPGIAAVPTIEAGALVVAGQNDMAIKSYLDTIAMQPGDESAYTGLAQAVKSARAAGATDTRQLAKAYLVLGDHMLGQERVADAVGQYEAALQVAPDYREAALHLEQARARLR